MEMIELHGRSDWRHPNVHSEDPQELRLPSTCGCEADGGRRPMEPTPARRSCSRRLGMARPSSVTRFTHATSASSGEKAAGWLLADISRGGAAGEAAAEKVDLPLA